MRQYLKYFIGSFCVVLLLASCKKFEFETTPEGESLGTFALRSPSNNQAVVLNAATPNQPIVIEWTAATKGVNTAPKYKWVASLSTGSISQPLIEIPSDNNGMDTKLTVTYKQLDDALAAKGMAAGQTANLIWSVVADNGSTKVQANQVFNIAVKRFGDGITPFVIYGPASSTDNLEINPTSTTDMINFVWQKANPANAGNPVRYRVAFIQENGNFTAPLFSISSGNGGADTTLSISWKQISDSLNSKGLTDPGQVAKLEWKVIATSGNFSQEASYSNKLNIVRLVRMYLVGSINGWNINAPFEMVADKGPGRLGRVFYTYIKMNTGDEFKFVRTVGDWGSAYGNTGTSGAGFTTGFNQGGNFQAPAAGVYRLTIDLGANMAYVQQKQVGLVGSLQGWNAASPTTGGLTQRNQFLILANMAANDEFKFHDGPVWDNGSPDKARWWGKGSAANTLDTDGNGANINNTAGAGIVRAIWDATDPQQVKYSLGKGQLRVVGGAAALGNWTPDNALNMTYIGNGKWEATFTLTGNTEFKFVSADGWSFNYGGSGGSGNSGTISQGGPNLNKPAGTYTVTVDEYTQTYTIY